MAGNTNKNSSDTVNLDAIDMPSYQDSGFGKSTGANMLQQETAKYPVDEASVQAQAKTQYQATFDQQQRGLNQQLSALIKAQTDDADLLNKQYEQSVNTMMAKLAKRGLSVGATPQATTAALNRFKNDVMAERQATYNAQQGGIKAALKANQENFDLGVKARADQIRNNSLKSLSALMTQMAQLQSSSFEDYVNYLLSKKKNDIQSRSAEIARMNTELESQSVDIARNKINLDSKALELEKKKIVNIDKKSIELAAKRLGIDDKTLDLARKEITNIDSESIRLAAERLGIDDKALDLARKIITNIDSESIGLAAKRLGIDDKKLDLARQDIDLDAESTQNDREKLLLQGDDLALDKKFLKLKYKGSGKSGGSKSRGKRSGSSSKSTSTSTPVSGPGRAYFAGSGSTSTVSTGTGSTGTGSASLASTSTKYRGGGIRTAAKATR